MLFRSDGNLSKRDATKAELEVGLAGLNKTDGTVGKASVKINGKLIEWDVKTDGVAGTKIKEDGGVSFKNAIKAAGFAEDDFKITYNAANITITAKAEGKNVIKGFKVTGGAAPDTQ